jgi:hypothetical protein
MKHKIEIEDTLADRVQSAIDSVRTELENYLAENKPDSLPCMNNDLDYSGAIHEIIDGSVPIYTREIKTAWFLHDSELEEAYNNSGVGDNPRENDGMAAIYFFISEKVSEWYSDNAQEIFDEWAAKNAEKEVAQ